MIVVIIYIIYERNENTFSYLLYCMPIHFINVSLRIAPDAQRTTAVPCIAKKKSHDYARDFSYGALNRTRTCDTLVNSQVLYRLSY